MPDSLADFQAKIDRLQDALDGSAIADITKRVAMDAKRDAESELDSDLGSDRKFSGWSRVKLGVGFELKSGHSAGIKPRPSGPWSVLDGGRKGGARVPKRRAKVTLSTPYGPRTYKRDNPLRLGPTRGKDTWKHATTVIARETPARVHREIQDVLRKVF